MRIAGLTVYVRDWPAALAWYTEVLGLQPVDVDHDGGFALLDAGDAVMLGLAAADGLAPSGEESPVVPGFEVDDIEEVVERLEAAGVEIDGPSPGGPEGYRLARVTDPEGNRINLFTYESG